MLLWATCLCCKVIMSGCEVVWVNRNVTDSFRVGDGCTNNTSVCTNVSAKCQDDGSCLCKSQTPDYRNPVIKKDFVYGDSYGCINKTLIRYGVGKCLVYFLVHFIDISEGKARGCLYARITVQKIYL